MCADRGIVWTQKRVRLLFFTQIAWDGWRPTGSRLFNACDTILQCGIVWIDGYGKTRVGQSVFVA